MKARLLHIAAFVLGALTIALTLLEKLPKYAAIAGSLLLAIANIEKMSPSLVAAVKKAFPSVATPALLVLVFRTMAVALPIILVGAILASCAHLTAIKDACSPSKAQAIEIAADLSLTNYESTLEQLGIKETICVVNAGVAEFLTSHSNATDAGGAQALTSAKAEEPIDVQHARAWMAKHGK